MSQGRRSQKTSPSVESHSVGKNSIHKGSSVISSPNDNAESPKQQGSRQIIMASPIMKKIGQAASNLGKAWRRSLPTTPESPISAKSDINVEISSVSSVSSVDTLSNTSSEIKDDRGSNRDDSENPCLVCGIVGLVTMLPCNYCAGQVCYPCTSFSDDRLATIDGDTLKWKCPDCLSKDRASNCPAADPPGASGQQLNRIEIMLAELNSKIDSKIGTKELSAKLDSAMASKFRDFETRVTTMVEQNVQVLTEELVNKHLSTFPTPPSGNPMLYADVVGTSRGRTKEGSQQAVGSDDNGSRSEIGHLVREELGEIREIESKKLNLVVFGLTETPVKGNDEILKSKEEDAKNINKLCHLLSGDDGLRCKSSRRLGVNSDISKNRPILVEFNLTEEKQSVLRNAFRLKGVEGKFASIGISNDFTLKQRQTHRKLVQEMIKRKDEGEANLVIRQGRIVTRTNPTQPIRTPTQNRTSTSKETSPLTGAPQHPLMEGETSPRPISPDPSLVHRTPKA
jgi:hypothetical protein